MQRAFTAPCNTSLLPDPCSSWSCTQVEEESALDVLQLPQLDGLESLILKFGEDEPQDFKVPDRACRALQTVTAAEARGITEAVSCRFYCTERSSVGLNQLGMCHALQALLYLTKLTRLVIKPIWMTCALVKLMRIVPELTTLRFLHLAAYHDLPSAASLSTLR